MVSSAFITTLKMNVTNSTHSSLQASIKQMKVLQTGNQLFLKISDKVKLVLGIRLESTISDVITKTYTQLKMQFHATQQMYPPSQEYTRHTHHWIWQPETKLRRLSTLHLYSRFSFSCNCSTKSTQERSKRKNWTYSQTSSATLLSLLSGSLSGSHKSVWFKLVELLLSVMLLILTKTYSVWHLDLFLFHGDWSLSSFLWSTSSALALTTRFQKKRSRINWSNPLFPLSRNQPPWETHRKSEDNMILI